jgi:hypothetical protein
MTHDPTPTLCGALDPLDLAILTALLTPLGGDGDDDPHITNPGSTWRAETSLAGPRAVGSGDGGDQMDGTATTEWDQADERTAEAERAGRKGRRR